jgi:acetyl esterase/lipase
MNAPMLLFVHGGGWSIGDKSQFGWVGEQLAAQGMLVALTNYRLSPAVQHPAHTQDVARAVAWLYRNGPLSGGDPARLYVMGHSAGAQMAALVALDRTYLGVEGLTPANIRSVVGIAGPAYDLDTPYAATPMASLLYPAFGPDTSRWSLAAPLHYVQPYAPSFFLIHGSNDQQAPLSSTQAMATALQQQGVPTKVELLQGPDHMGVLSAALPLVRVYMQ